MTNWKDLTQQAVQALRVGKVLLYPTDTIWGLGCDATNEKAVQRIFQLKQRAEEKSFIVLVDHVNKVDRYFKSIPDVAYDILDHATRPTTLILDDPQFLAPSVIASDNSAGIRVCQQPQIATLIRSFKKPIVSTSANVSGQPSPKSFEDIASEIKERVDFIFDAPDLYQAKTHASSIIKIGKDAAVKIIRA